MALLMCPNCRTGMKEIAREGVTIDMCPDCHGVWLDRGELQKLLDASRHEAPTEREAAPRPYRDGEGRSSSDRGRRKSRLESIFDIFD
jgi:Zn-finger nucleic acid-binding protein